MGCDAMCLQDLMMRNNLCILYLMYTLFLCYLTFMCKIKFISSFLILAFDAFSAGKSP